MSNSKKSKSPAKRNKKKARIKALKAASAAASRSLGASADGSGGGSPHAAAMSAAASAATAMGFTLAKPGQVSAGEARVLAEAVASATAERLGVRVAQSGKLSRSEALQAVGLALATRPNAKTFQVEAGSRLEKASAAEARILARFDADTGATLDKLSMQADAAKERLLPKFQPNPTLSRIEAVQAATNYIMDRLGYPRMPVISRREAAGQLQQRQRSNTAPLPVRRVVHDTMVQERRRPRAKSI